MAKPKKEGQFLNCYIRKDISDALTTYSDDTGIPKTRIVEKALLKYLTDMGLSISEKKKLD